VGGAVWGDQRAVSQVVKVEQATRSEMLERVVGMSARARATWVFDNTFWTELVNFVDAGGGDQEWAQSSFGDSLGMLGSDAVFVYGADRKLLYSAATDGIDAAAIAPDLDQVFGARRVQSFYAWRDGVVLEVHSATIHLDDDRDHAGPPHGVLTIVRRWDAHATEELSSAMNAEISFGTLDSAPPASSVEHVVGEAKLLGAEGAPAAVIRARSATPMLASFASQRQEFLRNGLFLALAFAVVIASVLHRWMIVPLGLLTRSLTGQDASALADRGDEFGALARLLNDYFKQSDKMAAEIRDRIEAEQAVVRSLREKEVLLKEIHHRVKNNLQIISSLLMLQSDHVPDEAARKGLRESVFRVRSMALVHQQLYGVESLARIDLADYARALTATLQGGLAPWAKVDVVADQPAELSIELAVPLALILNELITNALKYGVAPAASPRPPEGDIRVDVRSTADDVTIVVRDVGPGLPEGFSVKRSRTLGLQLVNALLKQVRGTIEIQAEGGATFTIRCPTTPVR
jgi:two-component sensor histidine kinase/sensor domain CHASE-containing protein